VLAINQPANWPRVWSTMDAEDLLTRLSNVPLLSVPGLNGASPDQDLATRLSRLPLLTPSGFGDVVSDITSLLQSAPELLQKAVQIINAATPELDTILQVVQDPAFPQIIDRVKTLQAIAAAKTAGTPVSAVPSPAAATPTPTGPTDTGISQLLPIFDAAIFVQKHPAAQFTLDHPVLVGAGVVLLLVGIGTGIGVAIGRASKKCTTASVGRRYRRKGDR